MNESSLSVTQGVGAPTRLPLRGTVTDVTLLDPRNRRFFRACFALRTAALNPPAARFSPSLTPSVQTSGKGAQGNTRRDVPELRLRPTTRDNLVRNARFESLIDAFSQCQTKVCWRGVYW